MKWQRIFLYEFPVRGLRVLADPKHLIPKRKIPMVVVPEITRFRRASRSAVLRVEVKHKFLTLEVIETYLVAVLVHTDELRCLCSYLQHIPEYSLII